MNRNWTPDMLDNPQERMVERRTLDVETYQYDERVDAASIQLEQSHDYIRDMVVVRARRALATESLECDRTFVKVVVPVYVSWWDHLKDKCLPAWMRGTVRKVNIVRSFDISVKAFYPTIRTHESRVMMSVIQCQKDEYQPGCAQIDIVES